MYIFRKCDFFFQQKNGSKLAKSLTPVNKVFFFQGLIFWFTENFGRFTEKTIFNFFYPVKNTTHYDLFSDIIDLVYFVCQKFKKNEHGLNNLVIAEMKAKGIYQMK